MICIALPPLVRYVLLPAHLGTQWNKMGVISQALELLENMRKANILPRDEVSYSSPSTTVDSSSQCH